jgi:hypothetical protein
MIAYVECPPTLGQGIHRVVRELKAHAPAGVTFTEDRAGADHIVHHVVGVGNFSPTPIDVLIEQDAKRYSVIQYCLKTTEQPGVEWWDQMVWGGATCVWSYYDLIQRMKDEQHWTSGEQWPAFYHAPLGVSAAFHPPTPRVAKAYLVGTSGYLAEPECIDAWFAVCEATGQRLFHLGPWLPCFNAAPGLVTQLNGIDDATLAMKWAACHYVNGLRATEGFELPAAEGLACGARPVLFDRAEHREWFEARAVYITEGRTRAELTAQLRHLVPTPLMMPGETTWAREQFNWGRLCQGFWARVVGTGGPR